MPRFAHLGAELRCPSCDTVVTDVVWFQWGLCAGYGPEDGTLYKLGDAIRWHPCDNGSILSWAYFKDGERELSANIGDTAIMDIVVRDWYQFYLDDPAKRRRCEACQSALEGAVVEIRNGVITRAWIYQPGEFDNDVDYYILQADGTRKPMPEWEDHPMGSVRPGC